MAKPVGGSIYYDTVADRPRVDLRAGSKKLLTEDDATGGGTPSGPAGGDLGGTYPNPTVEALGTSGTAVVVGAAAPPSTGQVLTATSATTATWQTPSSGSITQVDSPDGSIAVTNGTGPIVSVEANFGTTAGTIMEGNQAAGGDASGTLDALVIPGLAGSRTRRLPSPDARDDEFESTTLTGGWGIYSSSGALLSTPVKAALSFTTAANLNYQAHTDRRPSWLCWNAPTATPAPMYLMKRVGALGTNDNVWCRVSMPNFPKTAGGNGVGLYLTLAADKAGPLPDLGQNMLLCGVAHAGGGSEAVMDMTRVVGGIGTNLANDNKFYGAEYFMICKSGTDYYFRLAAGEGGFDIEAGITGFSPTMTWVGWRIEHGVGAGRSLPLFQADFLRFSTTPYPQLPF